MNRKFLVVVLFLVVLVFVIVDVSAAHAHRSSRSGHSGRSVSPSINYGNSLYGSNADLYDRNVIILGFLDRDGRVRSFSSRHNSHSSFSNQNHNSRFSGLSRFSSLAGNANSYYPRYLVNWRSYFSQY